MENSSGSTSRRSFLKTSLAIPAALAMAPALRLGTASAADASANTNADGIANANGIAPADPPPLPTRALGKSGRHVSMVSLGGMMSAYSPEYLDIAWSMGMRYFDTADCYLKGESEKVVAQWLAKYPERRKDIFLVSKDHPHQGPEQLLEMVDRRLAACGTSYLDLFFIHGIGTREYGEASLDWPKSDAFKKTIAQLKSSGKCRMVGFSCHDDKRAEYLSAAAEGGFVDAIMVRYSPFMALDDPLNIAMTACNKAGIGLIAMKTMRDTNDVPKRLPEFDKLWLDVHQAKLHACWSDPRISAICNNIENVDQMQNSTMAARSYKEPLKISDMTALKEIVMAGRRTMCPGCPSCDALGGASQFAFTDIARFVTYYEQDGDLGARDLYHALPAAYLDHTTADLAALRDGCSFKTDYPEIIKRAHRYFA